MEDLKVSENYKEAYNYADYICTHAPQWLKDIRIPEKSSGEYTKGFQDRVRQHEKERNKNFSYKALQEKYGKHLHSKVQLKNKEKDRD